MVIVGLIAESIFLLVVVGGACAMIGMVAWILWEEGL